MHMLRKNTACIMNLSCKYFFACYLGYFAKINKFRSFSKLKRLFPNRLFETWSRCCIEYKKRISIVIVNWP